MFSKSLLVAALICLVVSVAQTDAGWRRFKRRHMKRIGHFVTSPMFRHTAQLMLRGDQDHYDNLESTIGKLIRHFGDEKARLILTTMAEQMQQKDAAPIDDEFDENEANSNQAAAEESEGADGENIEGMLMKALSDLV